MTWQPGQPIQTQQDIIEWQDWKRDSKLAAQRHRRTRYRRIDYYPSDEALAVIDSLTSRYAGGDFSSVINRLILSVELSG